MRVDDLVDIVPVEETLVSAVKVTLSVAVKEPVFDTSAVVDVRLMSVAVTEPVLLSVPDEVTSNNVPAELLPAKVAEPLVTSALTYPVEALRVSVVSPVRPRSMLVLAVATTESASVLAR